MKKVILFLSFFLLFSVFKVAPTHAIGLKLAPLLYNEKLSSGEKKKGFVDISNPNDKDVAFTSEVSAFRQINKNGDLAFYDAPEYLSGIKFDYDKFTLGPRESLRMYFLLDASKLPKGGIYATLFFRTSELNMNPDRTSIQPSSRVGTLLIIDNGGGGVKNSQIEKVNASFFQFGSSVKASADITNVKSNKSLAYFPKIQSKVQPFGLAKEQKGLLVFPGNTRTTPLDIPETYFGLVRLKITSGNSTTYKWVFAATGKGKYIGAGLLITGFVTAGVLLVYLRNRKLREKSIHN